MPIVPEAPGVVLPPETVPALPEESPAVPVDVPAKPEGEVQPPA